ncbi:reverse transcriptase domain-containing protein, partial [Tanacetum coccineum]
MAGKDKPLAILMIQQWERVAKQRVTQSFSPETTISFPSLGEEDGTKGPMIIEAEIGGHFVHRIYVDGGGEDHSTSAWMNFMVIRSPSQHNGIIGIMGIRKIRVVPSTTHEMLKFPVKGGIVTIRSSRVIPMECAMISGPRTQHPVNSQMLEEMIKVAIHPEYPEQTLVMVKKHDGSWRMCVDFKDLNKACPQDVCGYPFKCFLDAYKGYHQIKMVEEDEEKTAFITSQRIFCYTKMSFGLKNVGATYQRLVDRVFQKQIGRNLEVYVDDLVIKSHTEEEIIQDIAETFKTLRQINMKLNPKKCTFGMQEGMFLGYKVNTEGLKVCPDKADAVLSLLSPGYLKDVQKLNGKLASLNRFLLKSVEKSLPFFKTLKRCTKKIDFQWT